WTPASFLETAWFANQNSMESTLQYLEARFGDGSNGSQPGEGGPNDVVNAAEVEPNDGFGNANLVPLAGNLGVNITGRSSSAIDEDWFMADLKAGAIIDARLSGTVGSGNNIPLLSLYDATNTEWMSSTGVPGSLPPSSPITGSGSTPTNPADVALHYVIPDDGRYYFRVSDVGGPYTLQLRQYRPVLESEPVGTKQVLYLDFDGAIIPRSLFIPGIPGSARMASTRSFLPAYGIQDSDYDAFIDEVLRRVQHKFDVLGVDTTNPNYGIEIRNSRDHADPWGLPNVSRVVVGGTFGELVDDPAMDGMGPLGIAQSVDGGNFDTEETAIVMHDILIPSFRTVPIDPFARPVDVLAELMTFVIVHEAGHFFGGQHQDPFNNVLSIMDQFYDPIVSSGSGPDGIFGNADDEPIYFAADAFTPLGQFEPGGFNDVVSWIGWGLSGGLTGGATVNGKVFEDANLNRRFDANEVGFSDVIVYADVNGNKIFDGPDISTVSDVNGNYSLLIPPGQWEIRNVVPFGLRLTTDAGLAVNAQANQTFNNFNFGHTYITPDITGRKWNDANGNQIIDPGEAPIEGVWIYIDEDGDNRIDIGEPATKTRADGTYSLKFPGPGVYTIREVLDSGFVQTYPGPNFDNEHTIILTGNPLIDAPRVNGLDFGNRLTVDFGDAPASYGDASHGFVNGLILGTNWDAEAASQYSSNARGDDDNGSLDSTGNVIDDEDGIVLGRPLVAGSSNNRISVTAQNTSGSPAFLSGWIDFNRNGTFESAEKVIADVPVASGTTDVIFSAPADAVLGNTYARFRYSNSVGLQPTGRSGSGEVEDYVLNITDELNLAVDDRFGVSRNSSLNSLDVLANDFRLPGESLEIINVGSSQVGGIIQISPSNTILYTPPNGFVGQDVFTYTMRNSGGDVDSASVVVDVNLFFENPLAIDDSFDLPTNTVDFPLNVLANDIEGQNGALTVISVTQPDKGGQVSIATGGKSIRYTPARDFGGTEFFTYTVADASGARSSATVTLHTLPGDRADDDLLIQLVATDLNGNPISAVQQGDDFRIEMRVDDLRYSSSNPGTAAGVFAAYADLLYNLQLVSTVANNDAGSNFNFEVNFFNDYVNFQTGDADTPGIIDEFGAFSNRSVMNDPDPLLLAAITFNARSPGIASFMPDPADELPLSDSLLFDTPGAAVPIEQIRYIGTQIEIVGDGVQFPVAVDDSLPDAIPAGSVRFPIDVLANDLPGSTGSIT
ncbi:MAG: Ig-like domain-containing protein, partial [bacterium]|nr:Ig-like domain-containing protein [bacterium]